MSNRLKFNFVPTNPINNLDPSGHDDSSSDDNQKKAHHDYSQGTSTDNNGNTTITRHYAGGGTAVISTDHPSDVRQQDSTPASNPTNHNENQGRNRDKEKQEGQESKDAFKPTLDEYGRPADEEPKDDPNSTANGKPDQQKPNEQPPQPPQQQPPPNPQPPQQQNQAPPKVNPPPQKPATTPNQTPAPGNNNERARDNDRDIQQRRDREEAERQEKAKQREQDEAAAAQFGKFFTYGTDEFNRLMNGHLTREEAQAFGRYAQAHYPDAFDPSGKFHLRMLVAARQREGQSADIPITSQQQVEYLKHREADLTSKIDAFKVTQPDLHDWDWETRRDTIRTQLAAAQARNDYGNDAAEADKGEGYLSLAGGTLANIGEGAAYPMAKAADILSKTPQEYGTEKVAEFKEKQKSSGGFIAALSTIPVLGDLLVDPAYTAAVGKTTTGEQVGLSNRIAAGAGVIAMASGEATSKLEGTELGKTNVGGVTAEETATGNVPGSVVERQEVQEKITASAKQRVSDAIDAGGKQAKGAELQKLGKDVHDLSDATIDDAARDAGTNQVNREPKINEEGGIGSRADNEIVKGDKNLIHEKKYKLPESGEQLDRAKSQLENITKTADKGVLEVAKPPTVKELAKFVNKLPPAVKQAIQEGRIKIVTSLSELYKTVTDFFK